jgi:hypothetical protein
MAYVLGRGVTKDERMAIKWFQKAVEQGDANAQAALGASYLAGRGVTKDEGMAVEWFQKAAKQGNERAKEALKRLK